MLKLSLLSALVGTVLPGAFGLPVALCLLAGCAAFCAPRGLASWRQDVDA